MPLIAKRPARPIIIGMLKKAIVLSMLMLISYEVLGGVIKYLCVTSSLLFLSYLPSAMAGMVVLYYYALYGVAMRLHKGTGVFLVLFLFNITCAIFLGRDPGAIAFAVYLWIPFFLGLLMSIFHLEDTFIKWTWVWWSIATVGVLINSQITFPWTGQNYELLGKTVQTSREMWALGVSRLSGFSRDSTLTAVEIALSCIVLLCMRISIAKKLAIWGLSVAAIYLTTSKITLFVVMIAPLFLAIANRHSAKPNNKDYINQEHLSRKRKFVSLSIMVIVLIVISMPILTLSDKSHTAQFGSIGFFSFSSLYDRMHYMWPEAWDLLINDDTPFPIVTGRGLGGIGTAQRFFEPSKFNAGDNMFMYLYVIFGVSSLLFFWYLVIGEKKWPKENATMYLTFYGITLFTVLSGITSNGIESPYQLLATGLLIGKSIEPKQTPPPQHAPPMLNKVANTGT